MADISRRGARVLLDKNGWAAYLLPTAVEAPSPRPPSPDEFLNAVNDFWYHAVWTTKKFRRGELWVARSCCDSYMKWLLLRMMEWHARATHGWDYDTWHGGRFVERWADPRAVTGLRTAFAHYDEADVARALRATMDLFRWLAVETADRLGYPYPATADERTTELVGTLLAGGT
jgi:aminoglycoside 6-adenylyltransferase